MKKVSEIMDRREFIRAGGLIGVGTAAAAAVIVKDRMPTESKDPTGESSVRKITALDGLKPQANEDDHIRMQRELARAMSKPMEQRRWAMVIDLRKCVGCQACTIGCVAENKLPPGVVYRPVVQREVGEYPNVAIHFLPRPCMQCEHPSCVPVCPVHATWKRPDGVVVIDYDKCIGCRYCLNACPYAARTSDFGRYYTTGEAQGAAPGSDGSISGSPAPWEGLPSNEYGKQWIRKDHGSPAGNARKCHFCLHRLDQGLLPVCVTTCIGRATYFGDMRDPESLVTELVTRHNVQTLLPHWDNKPNCYYIV
jgi:Fe-S-cluster-containing dehydrogenase component